VAPRKRGQRTGRSGSAGESLRISGELDRLTAEVLRLEIQRLARRYGFEITDFRVQPIEGAPASA
jgi:hypothetical protein